MLGPLEVALDGVPVSDFGTDKVRALLAYLAVETDRPHRRESLAGLLWPDQPESSARTNLRRALADMRKALGDGDIELPFLVATRQSIQLNPSADVWVDTDEFLEAQHDDITVDRLEAAVDLYHGDFLTGFSIDDAEPFDEWSLVQREQLRRVLLSALRRLADHHESAGNHTAAINYAWRRVEADRFNEGAHRQVMRLLALRGAATRIG